MGRLRPGALAESLRLITENTVSSLARGPYGLRGNLRYIRLPLEVRDEPGSHAAVGAETAPGFKAKSQEIEFSTEEMGRREAGCFCVGRRRAWERFQCSAADFSAASGCVFQTINVKARKFMERAKVEKGKGATPEAPKSKRKERCDLTLRPRSREE